MELRSMKILEKYKDWQISRMSDEILYKAMGGKQSWNILNPALYGGLVAGTQLFDDQSKTNYVKEGYEGAPTVFGVILKLARAFSSIEVKPFIGDKDSDIDPIKEIYKRKVSDYTFFEHRVNWAVQQYALGEAIVYHPKLEKGVNEGKLMSFDIMPSQYTTIESGGPFDPIGSYKIKFDIGNTKVFKPENVWHSRLFPNIDTNNGKNFRGLPPISIAAKRIEAMNNGAQIVANTYKRGAPLGLLINETGTLQPPPEMISKFEREWERRHGNIKKSGFPILMGGKISFIPMSFNNFRDLKIIENDEQGIRELCNVYGISSRLMNDPKASTFNNLPIDDRSMYETRVIPDHMQYIEGLNNIIEPLYGITYKAFYDKITALKDDIKDLFQWAQMMLINKAITRNEARGLMSGMFRSVELDDMKEMDELDEADRDKIITGWALPPFSGNGDTEEEKSKLLTNIIY